MSSRFPAWPTVCAALSLLPLGDDPSAAAQEAPPPCEPFVGCAGEPETLVIEPDGGSWRVGYSRREPVPITEWVPEGETVHDRSRMLTFHWYADASDPEDAEELLRERMEDRCDDAVDWTVLESTDESVIYDWSLRSCAGSEDQHVVARISRGRTGVHYVFLTAYGPRMPDSVRDDWVRRLREARPAEGGRAPAGAGSGTWTSPEFEAAPAAPDSANWEPWHSTPGVHLRMVEAGRRKQGGTTLVGYKFEADGVPSDRTFRLLMWSSGGEVSTLIDGLTATHTGHLVCTDPIRADFALWKCEAQRLGELNIGVLRQVRGEATRAALVSRDGSVRAFARAVPFPLEAEDGACRLELESLAPEYRTFVLWARGFPAGSPARVGMRVGSDTREVVVRADEQGRFHLRLEPDEPGEDGGKATVRAVSPDCRPELDFEWGDRAARVR